MLKINKQTITLTKGDDASLRLVPRYKDRTEYVLTEGDSAVFRIKFGHTLVELECTLNLETNKIVANITPNDTKDFNPGIYRYEAELITSYGFHYTFIADQTFILGQEYEQRTTSTSNGNSSAIGGNLPEIDGVVDGEPVVYGDIQPTNPMMDYDELNHLPKLNGVTIKGSHDNAYYGIPTKTSDLENDSDFVSDENYVHTDNNYDDTAKDKVDALGTASTKNVPSEGNASPTEVVMGSDTRLSDSRPASDVYDWAKASTKPSYSYSEIQNTPTLGTAAAKNFTNTVTSGSTDLVESGAVKTAIDSALSSAYKHGGTKTVEELTSALLIEANQGYVYNITNDGVTTADFIEGAGKPIRAGDNVGIAKVNNTYKFDLLSGFIDTSNFVEKSLTSGLIKNDGTIDTTAYAKQNEMSVGASGDRTTIQLKNGTSAEVLNAHQDISGKANKSEMFITDGTGADADKTTIQLKDGLSKAVLIAHQDISGKAEKSEMSVTDGTGTDADKTTIQLKSGTSATVLKTHQDISGKADKVSGATNGNLVGLDANGNLTDSGIATTDVEEMQDELSTDYATVEGNPLNFTTLSAQTAKSTILSVEPIQDLHGYDYPWVGGAGKNLLPLTVEEIKSSDPSLTWNGNSVVIADVTFTILTDGDGNVTGIKANGTASGGNASLCIYTKTFAQGNYILNGGLSSDNRVQAYYNSEWFVDSGNGVSISVVNAWTFTVYCTIVNGKSANNIIFYPMIRLSTVSDATFAPYTNICPISGRSEIGILGCGKNLWNPDDMTVGKWINSSGEITNNATGITNTNYIKIDKTLGYLRFSKTGSQELGNYAVAFYDSNKNFISRALNEVSIVIPNNAEYILYGCGFSTGPTIDKVKNAQLQLEYGNQATQYTAHQSSNNLTINLGQTVYGGTLDVENGVLVVDWKYQYEDGSDTTNLSVASGQLQIAIDNNSIINTDSYHTTGGLISNRFEEIYNNSQSQNGIYFRANGTHNLLVRGNNYTSSTTLEEWTTWLQSNPLQVCYKLATPITINLTPHTINLLKGVNNISTDGDKITLTYRDGSVATLGDLTSAVDELDSKIDESKILTDTVTGDKYILVVTNGVLSVEQVSD